MTCENNPAHYGCSAFLIGSFNCLNCSPFRCPFQAFNICDVRLANGNHPEWVLIPHEIFTHIGPFFSCTIVPIPIFSDISLILTLSLGTLFHFSPSIFPRTFPQRYSIAYDTFRYLVVSTAVLVASLRLTRNPKGFLMAKNLLKYGKRHFMWILPFSSLHPSPTWYLRR